MSAYEDGNPSGWTEKKHGFYSQASKILLRRYRTKSENGKWMSSPYEALVFGIAYSFTVAKSETKDNYGYMYMSMDALAWEIGCSYSTVEKAIKNLLKDELLLKVEKKDRRENYDTEAYCAVMSKLESLFEEVKDITFKSDETHKKRKPKKDKENKLKRENDELKRLLEEKGVVW
jgi:hypothetical protein